MRWLAGNACIASLLACTASLPVAAQAQRPLWELGLGVAGLRLPHYRGADQSHDWLLPVPYAVYRGRIFKADRDGARAVLFESDRLDFDLSLAATAPTRSEDNDARRGMSDLAPTLEFGPNLNWTAGRGTGWTLQLRAPVRAALTLESHARGIGWTATPNLSLDVENVGSSGWNLGLMSGPVFGSRRFNAYFYDVPTADATADRPAYRSPGGYAGAQATATLSRRFERTWAGLFVRHDTLHGARFADSPLVRRRDNLSFGIAFSWVFATSSETVSSDR
ncbi:MipA/OmpV family protein [Methylibium petroleiphilum]|uniref:MipA/OmpV family protein n=1 Tax=Methylibium petroleiphilum TaxID=105560 RepID=UPI001ACB987F|nr:MipA/OmpV family protein [Methylibium petroleiphilum]MBN9203207.1 MipA/OmpV family protein [Methylibium petroleiphilum]